MEQKMNYAELLENSFSKEDHPTRLEFLSSEVFGFITYDSHPSIEFGRKAVEVCDAITHRSIETYIEDPDNYRWYLLMLNTSFFEGRLNWGSSIRGAWWDLRDDKKILNSCGLWSEDRQLVNQDALSFDEKEWRQFMRAIIEFAAPEMKPQAAPSPR
jgi:hypothetical protein